jgi:hypothetical protein
VILTSAHSLESLKALLLVLSVNNGTERKSGARELAKKENGYVKVTESHSRYSRIRS